MAEASSIARSSKENDRLKEDDSSELGFDIRPKARVMKTRILSTCCNRVFAKCCRYLSPKNSIKSVDQETWRSVFLEPHTSTCLLVHQLDRYPARSQAGRSTPSDAAYGNKPRMIEEMTKFPPLNYRFLEPVLLL